MPKANVVSCGVAEVFACFNEFYFWVFVLYEFCTAVCGCIVYDYDLMGGMVCAGGGGMRILPGYSWSIESWYYL